MDVVETIHEALPEQGRDPGLVAELEGLYAFDQQGFLPDRAGGSIG
jgi:hypothetical protein